MSFTAKDFIEFEIGYTKNFSEKLERPYGIIYLNKDNPRSYDSNHAFILDLNSDLDAAVHDITLTYTNKGLTPRIYSSFQEGELDILRPFLNKYSFEIEITDNIYMHLKKDSIIKPSNTLEFKRVKELDDKIIELITSEVDCVWTLGVIKSNLACEDFHLIVGYKGSEPVTIGSLNIGPKLTRVDDVATHIKHRCSGFCRDLIDYMIKYHRNISNNALYLYVSNPTAKKIYEEAGFVDFETKYEIWSAFREW